MTAEHEAPGTRAVTVKERLNYLKVLRGGADSTERAELWDVIEVYPTLKNGGSFILRSDRNPFVPAPALT